MAVPASTVVVAVVEVVVRTVASQVAVVVAVVVVPLAEVVADAVAPLVAVVVVLVLVPLLKHEEQWRSSDTNSNTDGVSHIVSGQVYIPAGRPRTVRSLYRTGQAPFSAGHSDEGVDMMIR